MSDVKANDNADALSSEESGDRSIIDKAKEAASDIDVSELMDKAKDAAVVVKDRSVDAATVVKDKVSGFVGDNEDKIDDVIDKTGSFVDEKLTRSKFSDKIDKAQEVAKGAVSKVGGAADGETEGTVAEKEEVVGDEQPAAEPSDEPSEAAATDAPSDSGAESDK